MQSSHDVSIWVILVSDFESYARFLDTRNEWFKWVVSFAIKSSAFCNKLASNWLEMPWNFRKSQLYCYGDV